VAFSQPPSRSAFVALLDGSVAAVQLASTMPVGSSATFELRQLWSSPGPAPVFSAPGVARGQGGGDGSAVAMGLGTREAVGQLLVCGHVDGCVRGLRTANGSEAWRVQLAGQLFADLAVEPAGLPPGYVLAATHAGKVYCLAAVDGAEVRGRLAGRCGAGTSKPMLRAVGSLPSSP
jgi:outer membrane protein assembly factor BamB